MIVEMRTYKIRAGRLNEFWEIYRNEGLPIQLKYQNKPLGFYFVEFGQLSTFIHMWEYENFEERENARNSLHLNNEWQLYAKKSHEFIETMNSTILTPLGFIGS